MTVDARRRRAGVAERGAAARGVVLAVPVVLAAVSLVACSADGEPREASSSADLSTPEPSTPGPLEAYLGAAGLERTQGEAAAELAEREDAIASCMAAEGFDYVPVVMVPGSFEASDDPPRGSRGFAEVYGYGAWRAPEIEPGQYTYQLDESANTAYRESLSPEARAAYDVALMGRATDLGDGIVSYDGMGCIETPWLRGSAEAEYLRGVQQEVSDHLQSLWDGEDPRLAEVDATWASCMRDAGYDDASPRAAESRVLDELMAAYEAASDAPVPADVVDEATDAERRLALADQDCRDATGWTARRRAVEHELQQEYLDAHRADLDALVEASSAPG